MDRLSFRNKAECVKCVTEEWYTVWTSSFHVIFFWFWITLFIGDADLRIIQSWCRIFFIDSCLLFKLHKFRFAFSRTSIPFENVLKWKTKKNPFNWFVLEAELSTIERHLLKKISNSILNRNSSSELKETMFVSMKISTGQELLWIWARVFLPFWSNEKKNVLMSRFNCHLELNVFFEKFVSDNTTNSKIEKPQKKNLNETTL